MIRTSFQSLSDAYIPKLGAAARLPHIQRAGMTARRKQADAAESLKSRPGASPTWSHGANRGYFPSSGLGLVVVLLVTGEFGPPPLAPIGAAPMEVRMKQKLILLLLLTLGLGGCFYGPGGGYGYGYGNGYGNGYGYSNGYGYRGGERQFYPRQW